METLNRLPWMAQDSVFERLAQIADISTLTKEGRINFHFFHFQFLFPTQSSSPNPAKTPLRK